MPTAPKPTPSKLVRVLCALFVGVCLASSVTLPSFAQDRRAMIHLLEEATDFRARVQAAFAIGNTGDRSYVPHLERALRDTNPAVRAAAATALGRLGDRQALAALRRARRDGSASVRMQVERSIRMIEEARAPAEAPSHAARAEGSGLYPTISSAPAEGTIPWPSVRYAVVVGDMANTASTMDGITQRLREEIVRHLRVLRGVAVFSAEAQVDDGARTQLRRRRIPLLRMDGNISKLERTVSRRDLSMRCEVSLLLLEEPGRNIRSVLSGAATGTEPARRQDRAGQERRLAQQALEAAVRSAMRTAATAITSSSR